MFLLALCLVGTALAAPAIPDAPILTEEHMLVSPYFAYPDPNLPLRALEMAIEAEPKEENAELPEPKEDLSEPDEPKESLPELPKLEEPKIEEPKLEEPKLEEPKPTKPLVVKLEIPKPPSFISNWISSLPISFPNFNIPFISDWFRPPITNPTRVLLHPAFYPGYPGAVIVEAPKA